MRVSSRLSHLGHVDSDRAVHESCIECEKSQQYSVRYLRCFIRRVSNAKSTVWIRHLAALSPTVLEDVTFNSCGSRRASLSEFCVYHCHWRSDSTKYTTMAQKCVHKGCNKLFTDPEEPCTYHRTPLQNFKPSMYPPTLTNRSWSTSLPRGTERSVCLTVPALRPESSKALTSPNRLEMLQTASAHVR